MTTGLRVKGTVKSGNVVTVGLCRHLHSKFLLQHSSLVYEDMKVLQKHVMLAIFFCLKLCDVRIGFIFKYFVICATPVLGDTLFWEIPKKKPRNLQEGTKLLRHITQDFFMIIQNRRM
jgi:hypothetical protein